MSRVALRLQQRYATLEIVKGALERGYIHIG
jgi:hypothetical protein